MNSDIRFAVANSSRVALIAQNRPTVPVGPRLRSADRASLRKFVSNEDLAKMDMKKKLAKIARLHNSSKEIRPPTLYTLERAKQRTPFARLEGSLDNPLSER